ncbi:MAG: acetyltransferase [Kiritimatiellae bacterium]|nr:acetyltransferase [Kiritimatiellia bacterium]MDD4737450.1 acetyltransferase [Kiritimatiellia bacterium]
MKNTESLWFQLIGASGHAKVIVDIIRANGGEVVDLFDKNTAITSLMGIPVIGEYSSEQHRHPIIVSIGDNYTRKRVVRETKPVFGRACHPSAVIANSVVWDEGTVIMHRVVVQADTKIGKHCIINTAASVDHDCVLEDFVHVGPNCGVCGGVSIGEGTLLGVGCSVIPGIKVGKWCMIGAGSVIIRDVPDGATVVGNPGKIITRE